MNKVVFAAALLCASLAARADDLKSVTDRYVAWRGGSAFEAMHSFQERGTNRLGGLQGNVEQWQTRDGRLRRNGNLGDIPTSKAVAAHGGWHTNTSGQIEDLADGGAGDRRETYMYFAGAAAAHEAHITLSPSEQREKRTWVVVRTEFPGNNVYDQFISADTGELLGMRITEDRQTQFVRFGDWRMVQGVRMPFSAVQTGSNAADEEHLQYTAIKINVPTPAPLFARPASPKNWSFATGAHATEWIDFDFFRGNQIFIPAQVNGVAVKAILDSGAGISVIDRGFAEQSGIKATGNLPVTGVGGQASMQIASQIRLQLATLTLHDIRAGVIDLAPVSAQIGRPMPFILGKEIFNALVIDIDFVHRRIAFRDPQNFSAPPDAVRVALGRHDYQRSVPVSVEGRTPAPFDFDLGNDGPLIIYSAYRDANHLLDGRIQSLGLSAGVGGLIKSKIATLKSISIGGVDVDAVPTEFPDAADNAVNSDRTAGNIGLPVFSRFRLITDYPHDTLWLVPDADHLHDPFDKDRSGVAAQPASDRLKVLMIAPGSPAQRAGLKEGAEIVAVNGQRIDAGYSGSALSKWSHQPAGTQIVLTLSDGTTQKLTLQDYF